jgi:hypothetical protein
LSKTANSADLDIRKDSITLGNLPMTGQDMKRNPVGRPRVHAATEELRDLRLAGLSFREIARRTGLGYGSVRRAYAAGLRTTDSHPTDSKVSAANAGNI